MGGQAWPSLIAVVGTLLGATVTYLFQKQNAERTEARALEQARRSERLAACEAFAGAMVDYRRGEYDRVHQRLRGDTRNDVYRATLDEDYRLRSAYGSSGPARSSSAALIVGVTTMPTTQLGQTYAERSRYDFGETERRVQREQDVGFELSQVSASSTGTVTIRMIISSANACPVDPTDISLGRS